MPHEVPSASVWPVSTHVCVPVLQLVCHSVQEPVGVHAMPAAQSTHEPAPLQTWLLPHGVPAVTGLVVAVHTGPPVLQAICDWTQAPNGVQSAPWLQVTH